MSELNENGVMPAGGLPGARSKKYVFNASFITYFIIILALVVLRLVIYLGAFNWAEDAGIGIDYIFTFIAQIIILAACPFILIAHFFKKGIKGTFEYLQFKKPKPYIFLGFALGFFGYFCNILINIIFTTILTLLGWGGAGGGGATEAFPVWMLFVSILFSAVLPGICEEITHRGLVLRATKAGGATDLNAAMLSGLFFGLFHMYIGQTFFTAFMGVMMAILVLKSKSIWPAIFMHFTNNLINVWMQFSDANDLFGAPQYAALATENPVLLFFLLALAAGAFIGFMFLFVSRARKAGDCPPKAVKPAAYYYPATPYAPYYGYGMPQQPLQGGFRPAAQQQNSALGSITPENQQSLPQQPAQSPNPYYTGQQPVNPYNPFGGAYGQSQPGQAPYFQANPYYNAAPQVYNPYQPAPVYTAAPPAAQAANPAVEPDGTPVFKPKARDRIFFIATIVLASLITIVSLISGF